MRISAVVRLAWRKATWMAGGLRRSTRTRRRDRCRVGPLPSPVRRHRDARRRRRRRHGPHMAGGPAERPVPVRHDTGAPRDALPPQSAAAGPQEAALGTFAPAVDPRRHAARGFLLLGEWPGHGSCSALVVQPWKAVTGDDRGLVCSSSRRPRMTSQAGRPGPRRQGQWPGDTCPARRSHGLTCLSSYDDVPGSRTRTASCRSSPGCRRNHQQPRSATVCGRRR